MRLVCYLGTRGCPGVLAEALRDHFDPLTVTVPIEPRLLGPHLQEANLEAGLASLGTLLAQRAEKRALQAAERGEAQLAGVFDEASELSERIDTRVLDPPIEEATAQLARESGARACYIARDALEILNEQGIGLAATLEAEDLELRTR